MTPKQFKSDMIALLPRLKRYALTLTRSSPDADDLLQDTCTQALSNWKKYDATQPLDRWIFTIMQNYWFSEQRKRKIRLGAGQMPIDEMHNLSDDKNADDTLYANQVGKMVMDLPSDLSETLRLVAKEGFSYKEVAASLNIPIGTVMSRVHRARSLLNDALQAKGEAI